MKEKWQIKRQKDGLWKHKNGLNNFLLEWFLKSLQPPISKDVATSGVITEEEAIFKTQWLDLIYAQSGMLYHILPDAPRSTYDPRQNLWTSCRWHCRLHQCKVCRLGDKPFEIIVSKQVCRRANFVCVFQSHSVDGCTFSCNRRPAQMVTNNQEGIRRKDVIIIVRVGKIIINPRTMVVIIEILSATLHTNDYRNTTMPNNYYFTCSTKMHHQEEKTIQLGKTLTCANSLKEVCAQCVGQRSS
jgi:hypothetical protein